MVVLMTVRTESDWPLWIAVRMAALADAPESFPRAIAEWADDGERRWKARLLDPSAMNLVALDDGLPVGLIRGVLEDGAAWIHSLWVSPAMRGQGLGAELIAAVERWAEPRAALVRLGVVPGNGPARELYRRQGYIESRCLGAPLPHGGHELVMEKELAALPPRRDTTGVATGPNDETGSGEQARPSHSTDTS